MKVCPQCALPSHTWVGDICKPCYDYYRRHGTYVRKSTTLRRRKAQGIKICQHCKRREPKERKGGKYVCRRCAWHWRQHNRLPPRHLERETCINPECRRPLIRSNGPGGTHGGRGRCNTCQTYYHEYGELRSAILVKRQAPYGWCQCGQPAVEVRTFVGAVTGGYEKEQTWEEPLCAECAALEDEGA